MSAPGCFCGTYYSDCVSLALNCYVYTDTIGTPATDADFSDGTNCYLTDGTGKITSVSSCPPPLTCSYADVYIDQADCDASDDYTVYCTYNQCNGGGTTTIPFPCSSGTGWQYGAFCYEIGGEPTFFIYIDGIENNVTSSYALFGGDCSSPTTTTTSTTTTTTTASPTTTTTTAAPTTTTSTTTTTTTATPTTTTTTSTTTTTTTAPQYDYYDALYNDCLDCGGTTSYILVAFAAGSSVTLNRYYIPDGGPDGFAYKVTNSTSAGPSAYLLTTSYGSFATCAEACSS